MNKLILFTFALTIFLPGARATERQIPSDALLYVGYEDKYFTALSQEFLKATYDTNERLSVFNPEFQFAQIEYFGINLRKFLKEQFNVDVNDKSSKINQEIHLSYEVKNEDLVLLAYCWDGYVSQIQLPWIKSSKAIIALRDYSEDEFMGRSVDGKWTEVLNKGKLQSPGPYYIVWDKREYFYQSGWPYQIRAIFLTRKSEVLKTTAFINSWVSRWVDSEPKNYPPPSNEVIVHGN